MIFQNDNLFPVDPSFSMLTKLSSQPDRCHVLPEPTPLILNQKMKQTSTSTDYAKLSIGDLLRVISDDFQKEMVETFETVNTQLKTAHKLEPLDEELEFALVTSQQVEEKFMELINKEEKFLFPLLTFSKKKQVADEEKSDFNSFISALKTEHQNLKKQFSLIRKATGNYNCEPSFTPSHKLAFAQLNDLEQDFNRLFFVEEEYLFPRALKLQKS
jgi:iron-sulfur cluster repair protein YtfE (RIC family)